MSDILVVEDEMVLAKSIVAFLERRGFPARFAVDAASAKAMFERLVPRLVILDYKLNEDDGLDLLHWIRQADQRAQVVMMTGHGDVTIAVQAMKAGARDFLTKPAPLTSIAAIASELMLEDMSPGLDPVGVERIVGRSSAANSLRKQVTKLACASPAGAMRPGVLIAGPRGCGKGLVAMALHEAADADAPLSVLDCSRLDDGATAPLSEAVKAAQGGTLLLRRVGALDNVGQASLMRLLDRPDRPPSLVATTDLPLSGDTFLPDLLFRLQVGWIDVPALAERTADILPIAEVIARRLARSTGQARPRFSAQARAKLLEHAWPGNVAELVNCIERAMLMREDDTIDGPHIRPTSLVPARDADPLPTLSELEQGAIRKALHRTGGNVSRAAEMLGISRDTLRYRMEKFDLQRE
jgi:DNA-binding NtrC family response regulator